MRLPSIFLLLIAQFADCFCAIATREESEPEQLGIARASIEDVVPLSRGDFVVAALTHPTAMTVLRLRSGQEDNVAATPALFPYDMAASIVSTERGWWFSRYGDQERVSSVFFAVSDGATRETRVQVPPREQKVWIPLRGPEPRGVYVSVTDEEPRTLQFHEVRPSGTRLLGETAWRETGPQRTLIQSRWSAEALSDGRIAVLTTDEVEETPRLHLFGGEHVQAVLPCEMALDHPIDTAVDDSGTLVIVGLSNDRSVVALRASVDRPQSARCHLLAEETAARPPFGTPAIEWTGDAFLAAWIRSDGVVRATVLRQADAPPLVVDIGRGAHLEHPLRQLLHRRQDEVAFVWRMRSGEIVQRWMPKDVTGHTLAMDLFARLCSFDR